SFLFQNNTYSYFADVTFSLKNITISGFSNIPYTPNGDAYKCQKGSQKNEKQRFVCLVKTLCAPCG
ncbi:MAG TPA: hypothetical protein PLM41_04930, partial [Saprospiraceae bacterium]|nr:hypothetical protein [Saprospiraceae bacterium]